MYCSTNLFLLLIPLLLHSSASPAVPSNIRAPSLHTRSDLPAPYTVHIRGFSITLTPLPGLDLSCNSFSSLSVRLLAMSGQVLAAAGNFGAPWPQQPEAPYTSPDGEATFRLKSEEGETLVIEMVFMVCRVIYAWLREKGLWPPNLSKVPGLDIESRVMRRFFVSSLRG